MELIQLQFPVLLCVLVLYAAVVSPSDKRIADSVGREDAEMACFKHISTRLAWMDRGNDGKPFTNKFLPRYTRKLRCLLRISYSISTVRVLSWRNMWPICGRVHCIGSCYISVLIFLVTIF